MVFLIFYVLSDSLSSFFVIVSFIVQTACQIPAGRPNIVINPSTGKIGTSATLRCSSQGGDPTPTVKISRNSVLVDETATTANGQTVNDYTFTVQESDHYAVFECSVFNGVLQNQLTSTEYFFVVTTPFAPTLTGPTVVTTGTGPQNWTCVSRNGYPMQSMTMRNDNTQFTSGFTTSSNIDTTSKKYVVTGTLLWTPTLGDNGHTIYCDVTHTTLTSPQTVSLPLTVIGTPPVVTIAQPSFSQLTGQQITLGCTYQSPNSPAQSVSWRFTNAQGVVTDPVVISSPKYSGSALTNPSLTITSLAAADKGTYICRATNLIGTGVSGPTTLDVTGVSETNTTITSWTKPPTISETATTIVTGCGAKINTTEGKELFIAGIITLSVGVVAVIVGAVVLYRGCLYRKHNRAENYIDLKTSNHSITEPYSTLNQPEYFEIHDG